MILRKIVVIFTIFLISGAQFGCTGQLYTVTEATPEDKGTHGKYLRGVRAYPPQLYIEKYLLTLYVVDGKILRRAEAKHDDQKCTPGIKQNIVTRPDYTAPYELVYEPGFLESREFSITLKDGMVTAVNIKGSPDRGETTKNVLSPIAELASSAIGFAGSDEVLCNANPVLHEIERYVPKPDVRKQ